MGQAGVSVKILYNRSNSFGLTAKDEADAHVYCTNIPRYIHRWTKIFFVMIPPPPPQLSGFLCNYKMTLPRRLVDNEARVIGMKKKISSWSCASKVVISPPRV